MGAGIAQVCVLMGFETVPYDVTAEIAAAGEGRMRASIQKGVDLGKTTPAAASAALPRLRVTADLNDVAGADLVIEAAPEDLEIKRDQFRRLDALLASNTSSLSITALAGCTGRLERCLGLHFFNPPLLMALVEVVRGVLTSDETAAAGLAFARALGKTPALCRDTPGFIVNRVARSFYGEAR
jgi:3-hydroxybutyryl-CoA dehydrogenase